NPQSPATPHSSRIGSNACVTHDLSLPHEEWMNLPPNILRIITHVLFGKTLLSRSDGLFIAFQRRRPALDQSTGIHCLVVPAIRFHAQMRQHVMATSPLALHAQGGDVDGTDDDFFAGAGVGLSENATVVIDDHAAAGPTERRIVVGTRTLVAGHNE